MTSVLKILLKKIPSTFVGNFEFLQDEMRQYETRLAASNVPPAFK